MRRCLVRLQAVTQKGLEVPSSSQQLNTSTSRTITSKQGIVSSYLPDVLIPSVQLTPLVLDRATRWEIVPVSLMLLELDNSGWSKFDPWPKGLKSLTTIQDQVQDWKVWPLTNVETKSIEKSDQWPLTKFKTKRIVKLSRWEDRVALEDAETGEQIRYGELSAKVEFFFLQSFLFAKGGRSCVRSHTERFWRRRCHCSSTS